MIFNTAAKGFLNAVGASSGPLYATALLRAVKAAGPRASMPTGELRTIIAAMRDGIAQRGKAELGQRTMLDAWGPAAR
ncbi:MAG: DAK2 domain-containing protein [Mesorhizobium sp.]|nr:MAG: DAK2 domain-containing protein [Mesorhizobium sp.]